MKKNETPTNRLTLLQHIRARLLSYRLYEAVDATFLYILRKITFKTSLAELTEDDVKKTLHQSLTSEGGDELAQQNRAIRAEWATKMLRSFRFRFVFRTLLVAGVCSILTLSVITASGGSWVTQYRELTNKYVVGEHSYTPPTYTPNPKTRKQELENEIWSIYQITLPESERTHDFISECFRSQFEEKPRSGWSRRNAEANPAAYPYNGEYALALDYVRHYYTTNPYFVEMNQYGAIRARLDVLFGTTIKDAQIYKKPSEHEIKRLSLDKYLNNKWDRNTLNQGDPIFSCINRSPSGKKNDISSHMIN